MGVFLALLLTWPMATAFAVSQAKVSPVKAAAQKSKTPAPKSAKAPSTTKAKKKVTARPGAAKPVSMQYVHDSITKAAKKAGIPADILFGICNAESNLRTTAFVFGDGGMTPAKGAKEENPNHAFGMCQVLLLTAQEILGQKLPQCRRDFRDPKLKRDHASCPLFGAYTNALVAAKYFAKQFQRYPQNIDHAVAAYNTGSIKTCGPSGWVTNKAGEKLYKCQKNKLLNQEYVNRVQNFAKLYPKAKGQDFARAHKPHQPIRAPHFGEMALDTQLVAELY